MQVVPPSKCHPGHSALKQHNKSTECLLVAMLPTLFSSLNSLTFASTFFSSAHVCLAAGGIPVTPLSGSCSPYSERLPREVGAGTEVGVEMEGFNFLTFLGGSSLVSEDCSESRDSVHHRVFNTSNTRREKIFFYKTSYLCRCRYLRLARGSLAFHFLLPRAAL